MTSPAPRQLWSELLTADPGAVPSQTPEWLDAICAGGAFEDASRLYELGDGRSMVLPLVRRSSLPRSMSSAFSMAPTWGTGGLLANGRLDVDDVRSVFDDLRRSRHLRVTIRPDFLQAPLWEAARPPGTLALPVTHHVLDLDRSFDELAARFSKMARKAVRKAVKEGVTVRDEPGATLVPAFYDLYERWIERRAHERHVPLAVARRRGHANEPIERLHLLGDVFGDSFRVWVAELGDVPIAAMITLIRGDVALAWRAASDKELAGPTRANDLIHRHAIEYACTQGCRYYNMGESGGVESLMRFKTRFGATRRDFSGYRLERLPVSSVSSAAAAAKQHVETVALSAASVVGGLVEHFGPGGFGGSGGFGG